MRFRNILVLGLCVLLAATQTQATLRAAIGSTGGSGVSASSPNSWTAAQTFTNSDIKLLGASTGATTLTSANSGASNFTLTLPAVTDTVVTLGASQTFSAPITFTGGSNTCFGTPTISIGTAGQGFYSTGAGSLELCVGGTALAAFGSNSTFWQSTFTTPGLTANGTVTFSALSTGTNADFLCLSSGGVVLIQSSACTISSLRFKEHVTPWDGYALPEIMKLKTFTYYMKAAKKPNHDPNFGSNQIGLTAEEVSKIEPKCAIYENDIKTPKSYRQKCVITMLVKGTQEQQAEIVALKAARIPQ
jgi:hypothetical protein